MRVPKRQSEILRQTNKPQDDLHFTPSAIEKMHRELDRLLKKDRPDLIKEVQRTAEMGDFSENFAYQQAKHALRRMNDRILTLEDRLKTAIPILKGSTDGHIRIGSSVTVSTNDRSMTFEIVGSQETSPGRGRISHTSPLGVALIGHVQGETILVSAQGRDVQYTITDVH